MAKKKPDSNVTDETIRKWMRDASEARTKLDEANGIYRATLKAAKADGVSTKMLIKCMEERKQDQDELLLEQQTQQRYRQLFNIPTIQLEMFPTTETKEEDEVWAAGELGYASGKRGDDRDSACPFSPGTPHFAHWHERFDLGKAAAAAEADINPKVKEITPKRRPGRPKKDAGVEAFH
jgi:uncharacterized protein (UPF0335 family)